MLLPVPLSLVKHTTLPITMARIANQIVSVCAWLNNFQPALISIPSEDDDSNSVEKYFESLYSNDYDADTDLSDVD